MTRTSTPTYDVVIWGASGFTGSLVARHLFESYGADSELRWALAGRNSAKLEAVREALGKKAKALPILIGDAHDASSLSRIVRDTRVLCSAVGPYSRYGSALVAACAQAGVDYCDLAGEPHWIRRMIDQHHEQARVAGARIVTSCGFDSIPSDLGVYFLNQAARETWGRPCDEIHLRVAAIKGGASGGTAASVLSVFEAASGDKQIAELLLDPYSLNPPNERSGPDLPDRIGAVFDEDFQEWIGPFIMAGINTRIVRRSNALMEYPYGRNFRYDEATLHGSGIGGRIRSSATVLTLGAFAAMGSLAPSRMTLAALLPKPGQGPKEATRMAGSFRLLLLGKTEDGRRLLAEVTGDRDPGYGGTSRMLGESAVCLAQSCDSKGPGGLLTPASALAKALLPRLSQRAGLSFRLLDE